MSVLGGTGSKSAAPKSILRALPRRRKEGHSIRENTTPEMMTRIRPKASSLKASFRLAAIAWAFVRFFLGIFFDKLLCADNTARRAVRLRLSFEHLGGTAIKLGQQLSLRADLISYEYCRELSAMLDSAPPMSFDIARQTIERSLGSPLEEAFSVFDPEHIGSASIACVFQAELLDGQRVAVKVRRPGIEDVFAADLRALGWTLRTLEWLTILRPGLTKFVRQDLADMLFEELDFVQEARYQELFRRYAEEDGIKFLTAPNVYFDLSGSDIIVQEYVEGTWISEIIRSVESNDIASLVELESKGIRPDVISKRLLLASYWSIHENMFFHADPHPANVLVANDGRLIFIDFGACGSTSQRSKRLQTQILHRFWQYDIEGAARSALALIDPLPHVDFDELLKKASAVWWRKLYAMRSDHSPWWDRTTASIWLSLLEVTREYNIAINLDTLRAMRASLLYDTLAVRIWKHADDKIFAEYERGARRRKARRFLSRASESAFEIDLIAKLEDGFDLLQRLHSRVEEFADSQPIRAIQLASKASYSISQAISCGIGLLSLLVSGVAVSSAAQWLLYGQRPGLYELTREVTNNWLFLAISAVYILLYLRRIQYRLRDRDS